MTGAPRPASLRRPSDPALAAPCPWCHAPIGTRCTSKRGKGRTEPHPARITASEEHTP